MNTVTMYVLKLAGFGFPISCFMILLFAAGCKGDGAVGQNERDAPQTSGETNAVDGASVQQLAETSTAPIVTEKFQATAPVKSEAEFFKDFRQTDLDPDTALHKVLQPLQKEGGSSPEEIAEIKRIRDASTDSFERVFITFELALYHQDVDKPIASFKEWDRLLTDFAFTDHHRGTCLLRMVGLVRNNKDQLDKSDLAEVLERHKLEPDNLKFYLKKVLLEELEKIMGASGNE